MPTIFIFNGLEPLAHPVNPRFYPQFNPLYCTVPSAWLKIASSISSWAAINSSMSVCA